MVWWLVAAAAAWTGCATSGGESGAPVSSESDAATRAQAALTLEPLASCRDAAASLRQAVEEAMNARIDNASRSYLAATGPRCGSAAAFTHVPRDDDPVPFVASAENDADFVASDRQYIYKLERFQGSLRIYAAKPAAQTRLVGEVAVPGLTRQLIVQGDRALVYSDLPSAKLDAAASCRDCQSTPAVSMLLYDLSDRSAPKLLKRLDMRGRLVAARRTDNLVHSVISASLRFERDLALRYFPGDLDPCAPNTDTRAALRAFETLRAQNLEQIRRTNLEANSPWLDADGDHLAPEACRLYRAKDTGTDLMTLVSFDLSEDEPRPTLTSLISQPGVAYVSDKKLYIAADLPSAEHAHATAVHAFGLGSKVPSQYLGSARVKGRVMVASSLDEWQDALRIVTRQGLAFDHPDEDATLSVLSARDGQLELLGVSGGAALNQDLRFVRFEGEHVFVTTSSFTEPVLAFSVRSGIPAFHGALAVPGYTTFMRMLDERHLLTVGYTAAGGSSTNAYFDRMLLQIVDVSDLRVPALRHELPLGVSIHSPGASTHYRSFRLERDKLALPITTCDLERNGTDIHFQMTFSGVVLYEVSPLNGFRELGRVASASSAKDADEGCMDWMSRVQPEVQRSVFIDEFVYAFSRHSLHVQDVRALGKDVAMLTAP